MDVLLLGADGMLSNDLVLTAPPNIRVLSLTHDDLDITDYDRLRSAVAGTTARVVVNAAAYTAVDEAESARDLAFRVNGEAVGVLATAAAAAHVRVVHFSTDYVFDGTATAPYAEDVPPRPLSVYGETKREGEIRLLSSTAQYLVIRTQWLFGGHGRSFVKTIRDAASAGRPLRVVNDQTGRPTWSRDLATATWKLITGDATGVFHVANSGIATWYELALAVVREAGYAVPVVPCSTGEFARPARRPQYSALDTSRYERWSGERLRHWSAALEEFLRDSASAIGRTVK